VTSKGIKGQDEDKLRLGMAVIMLISRAKRPLRVDELYVP